MAVTMLVRHRAYLLAGGWSFSDPNHVSQALVVILLDHNHSHVGSIFGWNIGRTDIRSHRYSQRNDTRHGPEGTHGNLAILHISYQKLQLMSRLVGIVRTLFKISKAPIYTSHEHCLDYLPCEARVNYAAYHECERDKSVDVCRIVASVCNCWRKAKCLKSPS